MRATADVIHLTNVAPPPPPAPLPTHDIAPALGGWDEPQREPDRDVVPARVILGSDGRPKLQIRVELGVLQMEVAGRPDGRGFGTAHETRLDHLRSRYRAAITSGREFNVSADDCRHLAEEARLYARRSVGWFALADWTRVADDARHGVAAAEFGMRHADDPEGAAVVAQGLVYALTMKVRAEATQLRDEGDARGALRLVDSGLRRLKRHFRRFGGEAAYARSGEVRVLKATARQLKRRIPRSQTRRLRKAIDAAVAVENFERAAVLHERLKGLAAA